MRADGRGVFPGAYIHDDCIENDAMFEGVDRRLEVRRVQRVPLGERRDGARRRRPTAPAGRCASNGRLVRLQAYEQSFDVPKYGTNRHGGFFKFSNNPATGIPPKLVVRDSTFRSDDPAAYGGNVNGQLGLPPGSVCERVMLIGTEGWPSATSQSWVDQCTDLRFGDETDWRNQVAALGRQDHPVL